MKKQRFLLMSLLALFSIHLSAEVTAKAKITIESDESEVSDQLFLCQDSDYDNLYNMVKAVNNFSSYCVNLYAIMDEEKYAYLWLPSLTNLVVRFVANAHESNYTVTFKNVVGDIVLVGENDTIVADTANSYSLKCNPGDTLEFIVNPKPSYERLVEIGEWGTICLPWASNEMYGAEFYEVEGLLDSVVIIEPVTELEAGVPYVFYATDSIQKVLYDPETVVTEPINSNGLIGVFDDYVLPFGSWQLVDNQIVYVNQIDYIPANRAYFDIEVMPAVPDEGEPSQFLPIVFPQKCGDNLIWDIDTTTWTLTISGSGDMYDFSIDEDYGTVNTPWTQYANKITKIELPNNMTGIGDCAFIDFSTITSVSIPPALQRIGKWAFGDCFALESFETTGEESHFVALEGVLYTSDLDTLVLYPTGSWYKVYKINTNVKHIREYAFAQCRGLDNLLCDIIVPPTCDKYALDGVIFGVFQKATLYVPDKSLDLYRKADGWKDFEDILPIECYYDSTYCLNDSADVTPTDTAVTFVFPIIIGAYSYTLIIYADPNFQQVVCTVTFNQSGAIITLTFAAPDRRGIVTEPTSSFTCTVPSLQPATSYYYELKATDEGGGVLSSQKGSFTTTGTSTKIQESFTNSPVNRFSKIVKEGQLLILRDGKTYNAQGGEL